MVTLIWLTFHSVKFFLSREPTLPIKFYPAESNEIQQVSKFMP